MKRLILAPVIAAAFPLAAHAEPVVLSCSGQTRPLLSTGDLGGPSDTAFEITLDIENKTIDVNNSPRVLRQVTEEQVVYSAYKGVVSILLSDAVTTLSRKTGVWRNQYGSGVCKVQESKKLF